MVIFTITWGIIASIILEQARAATRSIFDPQDSRSPFQALYDLFKISGKEDGLSILVKITVILKFISFLGLFLLVPVFLISPVLEPRLLFSLLCILLLVPVLLDFAIDALSLKHSDSIDRFAFSRNGLVITLAFLLAITGKYVLEFKFDPAFPESTGFPQLFSLAPAITGVLHVLFGIVAVISLALFNYRLESFKRPAFAMTPGVPPEWPIGFTGPFLAIDVISACMHRFTCLIVVVYFFFSPFNASIPILLTDQPAVIGLIVGLLINIAFSTVVLLTVSYLRRNKLDYLSLVSRRRFLTRVLVPMLLIAWLLLLIY